MSKVINKDIQKIKALLGKKYYKTNEDSSVELIRVVNIDRNGRLTIRDEDTKEEKNVDLEYLKGYTYLIADGFITFSIVELKAETQTFEDVMVCLFRVSDLNNGVSEPYAVCRQNITDIFYNYLKNKSSGADDYVGLSVSIKTCPENMDFAVMRACDDIVLTIPIHTYINDNIEDILSMINTNRFDKSLDNLFNQYMEASNKISVNSMTSVLGHCRTLELLLKENNFEFDYNDAFNITGFAEDISENIERVTSDTKDGITGEYDTLNNYIVNQLNNIFKINISNNIILEYDHDIDLDEISGKYLLLRDINNKLYIVNYTTDGEYRETDLAIIAAKEAMQKSSILYNKYN